MRHTFANIKSLYDAVQKGFSPYEKEGAFASPEVWSEDPQSANIVFIDEEDLFIDDDEDDDEEEEEDVPREMRKIGYDFLLVGPLLVDVLDVFSRSKKEVTTEALVRAVNYYSHHDSFEP